MIEPGQWVRGYSEGIFRVERIVDRYIDESVDTAARQGRGLGEPFPTPLAVLKRCLDKQYLKSLGHEVCDASICRQIGPLAKWRLERALRRDPSILTGINDYVIPTIENRYDLWLSIPTDGDHQFSSVIDFVRTGRTFAEIKRFMTDGELWQHHRLPINGSLFLINYDFEIDETKRTIFRDAKLRRNA